MGLIIKTVSKQVHVINKLGRLGTGVPLAPVLLFELYLAINCSSTSQFIAKENSKRNDSCSGSILPSRA